MSDPLQEAEFDESVFDTPRAAAEAPKADPEPEAAKEPEASAEAPKPRTNIEDTASKIGWAGKDEWKGDPSEWIDAPEFILKAAGEVLPSMRKSLEKANEEIKGLKAAVRTSIAHVDKARREGYEQRSRELQAELTQYAAAGDVENVKSVTADIVALEKEVREEVPAKDEAPPEDPDFAAWRETAPWYGKDKPLSAAFDAITHEVAADGITGAKAGLKESEKRLREAFPEKFAKPENPNRRLPGAVEGAGIARRQGGKSFSDMPREHQDMCLDLMKQSKAITKDNYAKEYFASEGQSA